MIFMNSQGRLFFYPLHPEPRTPRTILVLHGFHFSNLLSLWELLAFRGFPYLLRLNALPPDLLHGCWNPRLWVTDQKLSLKQPLSPVSTQHAKFTLWLYFQPLCISLTSLFIHLIRKILKHFIQLFKEFYLKCLYQWQIFKILFLIDIWLF